ncbi:MAG: hypothetical protein M1833_002874 [Piccolia ochrophora]|nr:MAG: hypothetical protein M1833_002874 [Piccolia ochrophora]
MEAAAALVNFAEVVPGIYRSGFPKSENFDHLKKLSLKTILTLVPEEYPASNVSFMQEHSIQHFQIPLPGKKEPFGKNVTESIDVALKLLLDRANHPILIHCNQGKHRTGCVAGCFRKLLAWDLLPVVSEYRLHAGLKVRDRDLQFIALFVPDMLFKMSHENGFIPALPVIAPQSERVAVIEDNSSAPDAPSSPRSGPALRRAKRGKRRSRIVRA